MPTLYGPLPLSPVCAVTGCARIARMSQAAVCRNTFFAALAVLAAGVQAAGPSAFALLVYSRPAVAQGELWRLVTGHLVHAGAAHLFWNLAGLALVWTALGPRLGAGAWLATAAATAVGSSAGIFVLHPEIRVMAGLSGVLHGLMAAGAVAAIRGGRPMAWLLLAVLAGKVAWEMATGVAAGPGATLSAPVAFPAHLWGAVLGALAGLALARRPRDGTQPAPAMTSRNPRP